MLQLAPHLSPHGIAGIAVAVGVVGAGADTGIGFGAATDCGIVCAAGAGAGATTGTVTGATGAITDPNTSRPVQRAMSALEAPRLRRMPPIPLSVSAVSPSGPVLRYHTDGIEISNNSVLLIAGRLSGIPVTLTVGATVVQPVTMIPIAVIANIFFMCLLTML